MGRILVVTNDFPPRRGGIETFVFSLCERFPADEVVVLTGTTAGAAAADALVSYPVHRHPSQTLLPTRSVTRLAQRLMREQGCDRVLFGAALPLGLMAPALRSAGARRVVALTHGHEPGWARVPVIRRAVRRVADDCDTLTYVSEFCRRRLQRALSEEAQRRLVHLAPGVDSAMFHPACGGEHVRARLGIAPDQKMLLSTSRLVTRKGQDMLLRAMPAIGAAVPDTVLVVVGDGPARPRLERLTRRLGIEDRTMFVGGIPWKDIPAWFDSADVFVAPSRSRWAGIEPEALGIVYLEAQAVGCPVVVGRSGGAPETVRHGTTGFVVNPRDPAEIAARTVELLTSPDRRRRFGEAATQWAHGSWSWEYAARTALTLLNP